MAVRYCPRCRAQVEDVGGYCLLGHSFPEDNALLGEIRAEVNAAFERAKIQIDVGFDDAEVLDEPEPERELVTSPVALRELAAENGTAVLEALPTALQVLADENSEPVLSEADVVARRRARAGAAWRRIQDHRPFANGKPAADPISAFAPSPRMDWGPKPSLLRRFTKDTARYRA